MKILISTDFYIHNLGGVTTSILGLCAGLRSAGHEVKVLAMSNDGHSYREGDDYYVRSFPVYYSPGMRMSTSINDPLINELIEWGPDIIHAQSEGSALAFSCKIQKKCNIPLIVTCHTDYAYYVFGEKKDRPLYKIVEKLSSEFIYNGVFKIIVPAKKAMHFTFLQPFKDRLLVLPNGIELDKYNRSLSQFERAQLLDELHISANQKILVTASRLSIEKNIQEIIEYLPSLLQKVPEVVFLIVGDGPYQNHLQQLVNKNNLQDKVIFAGRKDSSVMWKYYNIADIFVSASIFELHSMSYLEALAQGLPLLCRDDEALDGVLDDGYNGFIYHNKEEFTEAASRILNDEQFAYKLSNNSIKRSQDFSCDAFAEKAVKIYKDVISDWNLKS